MLLAGTSSLPQPSVLFHDCPPHACASAAREQRFCPDVTAQLVYVGGILGLRMHTKRPPAQLRHLHHARRELVHCTRPTARKYLVYPASTSASLGCPRLLPAALIRFHVIHQPCPPRKHAPNLTRCTRALTIRGNSRAAAAKLPTRRARLTSC
jgi:hypothetical protein